jgi:hypothetical protein
MDTEMERGNLGKRKGKIVARARARERVRGRGVGE